MTAAITKSVTLNNKTDCFTCHFMLLIDIFPLEGSEKRTGRHVYYENTRQ